MMTVEMELDEIKIVAIDPYGRNYDLEISIYDDVVYLRSIDEDGIIVDIIEMTPYDYNKIMTTPLEYNGKHEFVLSSTAEYEIVVTMIGNEMSLRKMVINKNVLTKFVRNELVMSIHQWMYLKTSYTCKEGTYVLEFNK